MAKWTVFLSNGRRKKIKAKSATQAKYKYYASNEHYKTENSVTKVRKA